MLASATIDTRLYPLQALKAVRRLLSNPEDTAQVFVILRAMRGRSGQKAMNRFRASPTGAAALADRRSLLAVLQDREALAAMPAGSLGRTYLDFMLEEDLLAEGLVAPSQVWNDEVLPHDALLFRERMRDMHDLTHTLTGYGRDPLGELCLLSFMYAHMGNPGQALIVLMALVKAAREGRGKVVRRACFQAWRQGRKSGWLPAQDWEAMMGRPLEELRREVGVLPPTRYLEVVG